MTQRFSIHPEGFYLPSDPNALRASEDYQHIRQHINRRFHPLNPGVHWPSVYRLGKHLSQTLGTDFLIATYYSVAALKIGDIAHFASGLETLIALLNNAHTDTGFPPEKRTELITWMIARIGQDLRNLNPETHQRNDLFRCENACRTLAHSFSQQQPHSQPDLSPLQHSLNHHLTALEPDPTPISTPLEAPPPLAQKRKSPYWQYTLASLMLLGVLMHSLHHIPWIQQQLNPLSWQLVRHQPQPQPPQNINTLPNHYSAADIARAKDTLWPLYARSLNAQLHSDHPNLAQPYPLLATLKTLYPKANELSPLTQHWQAYAQQQNSLLTPQLHRFTQARRYLANLAQRFKSNDPALARTLTQYSNSLSPLYARLLYAQDQLPQHPRQAQHTLHQLQQRLNALAFATAQLMHQAHTKKIE